MDKYRRARRAKLQRWYNDHPAVLAWRAMSNMKWGGPPSMLGETFDTDDMSPEEVDIMEAFFRVDDVYTSRMLRITKYGKY